MRTHNLREAVLSVITARALPLLFLGFIALNAHGANILFDTTNLGSNLFRFDYTFTGVTFQANQELDFMFVATEYSLLENPVVGSGFTPVTFQPNSPLGSPGIFGIFSPTGPQTPVGTFSVEAEFTGTGTPGSQPYEIDQYDASGGFEGVVGTGTAGSSSQTPEPTTMIAGVALIILSLVSRAGRTNRR